MITIFNYEGTLIVLGGAARVKVKAVGGGVRWHRLAREVRRGCPLVFYNCCIEDQTRQG